MGHEDLAHRASAVGALAEPVRRALYDFVLSQDRPVSREQAAAALEVPLHVARFHLDKLVSEGLLEVRSERLTGRTGPGAGRPAKVYCRTADEVSVSLPARRYDLAAKLLADAVETASRSGGSPRGELRAVARRHGRGLGPAAATRDALARVKDVLERAGYEPRVQGNEVNLANCPFHALVQEHAELVCDMNLALLTGLAESSPGTVTARLEPRPGRCCVVLQVE